MINSTLSLSLTFDEFLKSSASTETFPGSVIFLFEVKFNMRWHGSSVTDLTHLRFTSSLHGLFGIVWCCLAKYHCGIMSALHTRQTIFIRLV